MERNATWELPVPSLGEGRGPEGRSVLLAAIAESGAATDLARAVQASGTYTVVFREAAKGPLHQTAGGLFEASVRDPQTGRIVQNVLLQPANVNFVAALTTVALRAALFDIARRLDTLQKSVDRIESHLVSEQRGAIIAALKQIDRAERSASEAVRTQTLVECRRVLAAEFEALCLKLSQQARDVPDPRNWSMFNWSTSAKEITRNALAALRIEVTLALLCAEAVTRVELELSDSATAAGVLEDIVQTFRARVPLGDIHITARRAREAGLDEQPHLFWQQVLDMLKVAETRVLELRNGPPELALEVAGKDLQAIVTSQP
jgi:hypothetical protein